MALFTILLNSHWSKVLSEIFLHYHENQPFSFPKWYHTWKSGQNWRCYKQKHFASALKCKNYKGLLGGGLTLYNSVAFLKNFVKHLCDTQNDNLAHIPILVFLTIALMLGWSCHLHYSKEIQIRSSYKCWRINEMKTHCYNSETLYCWKSWKK